MQVRITKTRVAMAALFVLAGVGLASLLSPLVGTALATAGQIVNISDRSGSAYFAKVSSDGKLAVGDGAGPLDVGGTVTARPAAPAMPWVETNAFYQQSPAYIAGPSSLPINLTSLTLSTTATSGSGVSVFLGGRYVPNSATTCEDSVGDGTLWQLRDMGPGATPLSFTFPTPLQYKAPANMKACLRVSGGTGFDVTQVNAVGFYGG
jgi:hypothetical protein